MHGHGFGFRGDSTELFAVTSLHAPSFPRRTRVRIIPEASSTSAAGRPSAATSINKNASKSLISTSFSFIAFYGHRPVTTQRQVTPLRVYFGGEVTANNGAAENRSGRLRSVTACASASDAPSDSGWLSCAPPLGTGCASPPPPSAVSELESLAVATLT